MLDTYQSTWIWSRDPGHGDLLVIRINEAGNILTPFVVFDSPKWNQPQFTQILEHERLRKSSEIYSTFKLNQNGLYFLSKDLSGHPAYPVSRARFWAIIPLELEPYRKECAIEAQETFAFSKIESLLRLPDLLEAIHEEINKWCSCRASWDSNSPPMIRCDNTRCTLEWYHKRCVGLDDDFETDVMWYCPACVTNNKVWPDWTDLTAHYSDDILDASYGRVQCMKTVSKVFWQHRWPRQSSILSMLYEISCSADTGISEVGTSIQGRGCWTLFGGKYTLVRPIANPTQDNELPVKDFRTPSIKRKLSREMGDNLPPELHDLIVTMLSISDLKNLRLVSKSWNFCVMQHLFRPVTLEIRPKYDYPTDVKAADKFIKASLDSKANSFISSEWVSCVRSLRFVFHFEFEDTQWAYYFPNPLRRILQQIKETNEVFQTIIIEMYRGAKVSSPIEHAINKIFDVATKVFSDRDIHFSLMNIDFEDLAYIDGEYTKSIQSSLYDGFSIPKNIEIMNQTLKKMTKLEHLCLNTKPGLLGDTQITAMLDGVNKLKTLLIDGCSIDRQTLTATLRANGDLKSGYRIKTFPWDIKTVGISGGRYINRYTKDFRVNLYLLEYQGGRLRPSEVKEYTSDENIRAIAWPPNFNNGDILYYGFRLLDYCLGRAGSGLDDQCLLVRNPTTNKWTWERINDYFRQEGASREVVYKLVKTTLDCWNNPKRYNEFLPKHVINAYN